MIDYEKFFKKDKSAQQLLDLSDIDSLNSLEINDLFFYLANKKEIDKNGLIKCEANEKLSYYMDSIGFFSLLANIRGNKDIEIISAAAPISLFFDRLMIYNFKQDFYGEYETVFSEFAKIGLSEKHAALITSSIGEIIDNAFCHNLGKWNSEFGPLVILLAQHFPDKRNINISICDFGVGFRTTLIENYPSLKNEAEAIKLALKVNTTGRANKAGGNGLVYLQKNIFNGFAGNIMIRSGNTLAAIEKREEAIIINNALPFNYGANIFINLNY